MSDDLYEWKDLYNKGLIPENEVELTKEQAEALEQAYQSEPVEVQCRELPSREKDDKF